MTKIQLEKSLKLSFRAKAKKLQEQWAQERSYWSLGVGTALVIGMAIGKVS